MELFIIGVIVNILSSAFMALGWALQKKVHIKAATRPIKYRKQCAWWLGLLSVALAQTCGVISTPMVNQSTMSVVGAVGIILNVLVAYFMLHESISTIEILGISLFIPGIIFTLWFASMDNNLMNKEEFEKTFYTPIPMAYLILNLVLVTTGLVFSYYIILDTQESGLEKSVKPRETVNELNKVSKVQDLAPIIDDGPTIVRKKKGALNVFTNLKWRAIPLITYPYAGGFCAGLATTFVRVFFGLLLCEPAEGENSNFSGISPKVYIGVGLFCAVFGFYLFNVGLKHFDSIYMAPLIKISSMIHKLMGGIIYLNEYEDYYYRPIHLCLFSTGIMICIFGIGILVFGNVKSSAVKSSRNTRVK